MIPIAPRTPIVLMIHPEDFRKGIDSLAATCRKVLQCDPFSGTVFVFRNRNKTAIKLLIYDGQGFWLLQKRLSQGRFHWWPEKGDENSVRLAAHELQLLIWNGNPTKAEISPLWREVC